MKFFGLFFENLVQKELYFPLSLVLFEFSVYIANDMIQPGMIAVTKSFNADIEWVPTSMTAFLFGGIILQWLLGPISDRKGRRPIMLAGVILFISSCLGIIFVDTIEKFIFMRFLQGFGLCFIGVVGYASIQESFSEKSCIKITSLMANVALIAPLIGPLVGSIIIVYFSWKIMFIFFAFVASIALFGLWNFMPETATKLGETLSPLSLCKDYYIIFTNKQFIYGSLAISFICLPLLSWLAQSPVLLINDQNLTEVEYGLLQIPVFGGLIVGNIVLAFLNYNITIKKLIKFSSLLVLGGLIISTISTLLSPNSYLFMIAGISTYAIGVGIANASLYRLTLFSCPISKGTVSAALGMLNILIYTLGIEFAKLFYKFGGIVFFNFFNLISVITWFILSKCFINLYFSKKLNN